jgi:hypothetical protein
VAGFSATDPGSATLVREALCFPNPTKKPSRSLLEASGLGVLGQEESLRFSSAAAVLLRFEVLYAEKTFGIGPAAGRAKPAAASQGLEF